MKYIIVSKNIANGKIGNDSADLGTYFELGWELIVTRAKLLDMLYSGLATKDDIIVTDVDRFFLYSSLFDQCMDYKDFIGLPKNEKSEKVDLVEILITSILTNHTSTVQAPDRKLHQLLMKFDYCDLKNFDTSYNFVGLQVRMRDHNPQKNLPLEFWKEIICLLKKEKINSYVFGRGTEELKNEATCVGLREWASLMNNPMCRSIVGTHSGGMVLGQFCYNGNKMIIIDNTRILQGDNHPLLFGECSQFSLGKKHFIESVPSPKELVCMILS